jgi:hypothetical protein
MAENLLKNGGFEADWGEERSHRVVVFPADGQSYQTDLGEFHTPPGWLSWFYHDPGEWDQPEVGDIRKEHVPYRVYEGEKAARLFTFFRKHDAGFLQQVGVEPGVMVRLTAQAHAWSNHPLDGHEDCGDNPRCSCGVGSGGVSLRAEDVPPLTGDPWNDAIGNFSFMLGIDPEGGIDPFADTVVWGPVAHIYNAYHQVPPVEAEAEGDTVTIFLRSKTLWAFKHNDAYWDGVELVAVEEPPEPEPEPEPEPGTTEWDYPVIRKGSKIGVHAIFANRVPTFARELSNNGAQFPVVKAVDDLGWLSEVKDVNPDAITIGRYTSGREGCGELDNPDADLNALADALLNVIKNKADAETMELVDFWEIVNEPDPPGPDGYRRLALLMMVCMEKAEAEGLRLALFGLNAGTPEWDEMEAMVETGVFARARRGGHILTLHEGTFDTHDPSDYWPDTIPGSPVVEGAGPLHFRYRFLYHLLEQREETVPLVVSEWYLGDEQSASVETILDALTWYDGEVSRDYYVWGVCPFTLGPTADWRHTDYERVYPAVVDHMIAVKARQNALLPEEEHEEPETPECVPPRVPYRRSYVLLPQIRDQVERLEWRTAVAIGSSETMETVGHSADDAGIGPPARRITVINPAEHGEDMRSWYQEHYPGALYREIETDAPWEVAIHLLPDLREDIALSQSDPRWQSYDFGEHPGGGTIGGYGGLLASFAVLLRNIYGRRLTPPHLDKLLVAARAAFVEDNVLLWADAVALFSAFDDSIEDDRQRSIEELETLWNQGWEIILREVDEEATPAEQFVYLERIIDDVLHIIDPRDGERKQRAADDYLASIKGIRAAHLKEMPSTPSFDLLAADVEVEACVPPREPYDRTYVLLPQIEDTVERLEWRVAAAIGSSDAMYTVGHSADDAGVGPLNRCIIAVNPDRWGGDLEAWYNEHYQDPELEQVVAETAWDMAIRLLPTLGDDIALAQGDARWADYDFGEHPDVGAETIGRYGCFLTGLSIILRKVYHRDVTPPVLDKLLVTARSAYVRDNLMAWAGVIPLFSAFDQGIKDTRQRSASELKQLLNQNWEIILRRADGEHFVYLEYVEGDTLHIIDTWDGRRKQKVPGAYVGIRAAHLATGVVPPVAEVLVGLHDEAGGEWMVDQGVVGCCLVHRQVQRQAIDLDLRYLQEAGIVVIGRLNWGYADGTGTLPRPGERSAFIDAVVETMLDAAGVDFFHVGNEPNNRQEWPGFGSPHEYPLTREYVTQIYNDIWHRIDGRVKMGPPPIDPYFGPGSNNREWWTYMLDRMDGADALFLHSKTQTNDPTEVWSRAKFSHWPLEWQYLHLRTVETSLEVVPERFQNLPVFVTELNPQNLSLGGGTGWQPDNDEWVHQAVRYFREERPVTGVVFYRYEAAGDQAPFGLEDKEVLLAAIEDEARLEPAPVLADIGRAPHGLSEDVWTRVVEAAT